jgi:hypothetical protein
MSLTQEVSLYASYASMECYILQWFYNAFSLVFGAPGYPDYYNVCKTVHEILLVNQKLQNFLMVWNFEVMYDQYLTKINSR